MVNVWVLMLPTVTEPKSVLSATLGKASPSAMEIPFPVMSISEADGGPQ